jgi:hypothetical protein
MLSFEALFDQLDSIAWHNASSADDIFCVLVHVKER